MRSRESHAMACHTRYDQRDAVSGQRAPLDIVYGFLLLSLQE